jgi:hypothetical protein
LQFSISLINLVSLDSRECTDMDYDKEHYLQHVSPVISDITAALRRGEV